MKSNMFVSLVCLMVVSLFAGCSDSKNEKPELKIGPAYTYSMTYSAEGVVESVNSIPGVDTLVTVVATVRYTHDRQVYLRPAYANSSIKIGDKVAVTVVQATEPTGGRLVVFATRFTSDTSK